MPRPRHLAVIAAVLAVCSVDVLAQGCPTEKLVTPDFQPLFQAHHYDLIVFLDVDKEYKQFLHDAGLVGTRPEDERQQYLHELARDLTAAKEQRLASTRFTIQFNLEFGPEIVVRAADREDVCDLARNPHVLTIGLSLPIQPA